MAIKTQSQLDSFVNGPDHGKIGIGENMAFFKGDFLTTHDKNDAGSKLYPINDNWRNTTSLGYNEGRDNNITTPTIAGSGDKHYWSSIFEISQPTTASQPVNSTVHNNTDAAIQYDSMNTTYEDILKNILWDVKTYLNWKNNLNDYNLSTIVEGDQIFIGTKYFTNKIYAVSGEYDNLTASNLTASNLTATDSNMTNLTVTNNLSAKQLSVVNHSIFQNTLSVGNNLSVNGNITIPDNKWLDGYAKGLKSNSSTKCNFPVNQSETYYRTRVLSSITDGDNVRRDVMFYYPSSNSSSTTNQMSLNSDTILPITFTNGEPNSGTAVPYARQLVYGHNEDHNLHLADTINQATRILTAGNMYTANDISGSTENNGSYIITKQGDKELKDGEDYFFKRGMVTTFHKGIPYPQNTIGFAFYAKHAFWSDLGEKYLADKEYEPGTLVKFGGEKEITIADDEVNAIVSTHAFDLNACLKDGTVICLCGRVPTKVIGKISKFDRIMLSKIPGIACKWDGSCKPIGRALESNEDEGIKLVECVSQFMV